MRLRLVALLLVSGACTSTQVTPLGPVPQEVIVDLQENPYRVVGTTADELLDEMNRNGPGSSWFRYRWRMNWTYRYGEVDEPSINPGSSAETVCKLSDIVLTLRFTRVLPEWTTRDSASPELQAEWDAFMTAVRTHGEGHRDIAIEAMRDILRRLKDLETSNCAFIRREARTIVDRLIEEANEKDRAYHSETRGGAEQGVAWPPRGR